MIDRQLESGQDLLEILDAINDGVLIFDQSGVVKVTNRAAEQLAGASLIGVTLATSLPVLSGLIDGRTNTQQVELPGGRVLAELIRLTDNPKPSAASGAIILRDPSGAAAIRARLEESERRFRSIVEAAPMGIHMYDVTADGSLVFAGSNPAADRILGVDNSNFLGKTIEQAFPPLAWTEVPSRYRDAAKLGKVWRTEQIDYQDGVIRGAFEVTAFQTSPDRMAAMFVDITERKRTEEERWKLALMMEKIGELVNLATPEGKMVFLNDAGCRMLGIGPEEIRNHEIMEVIPDHLRDRAQAEVLPALLGGGGWEGEFQYRNIKTGALIDVHAITMGIKNPATGELMFLANISLDITERKRAEKERLSLEAQIQHSQKLESLGVLAGGIAHDFNNILMGVMGNADLALMQIPDGSPARERVEAINRSATQAADLCRQMLAYSGKGRFVVEVLDLAEVIESIAAMLEVSVGRRAALRCLYEDDVPPVRADASQLRQIILNLVTNASEAITGGKGVITICTGVMHCDRDYLKGAYLDEELPEGRYSYFEVADTGSGMDRETLTRIFDPFFTTKFTGRGLGLSAVLGIIRGHKGTIKIYSEPGRGSVFKVLLPAVEDGERPRPPVRTPTDFTGTGTVLLVDDESLVRDVAASMLRLHGFNVIECKDGIEALYVFRERADEIMCVLLDLTMPNMDGEEAFRELRRIKPDVRVIMTSGYNEQEITQRFVGRGLAGFIQKPYLASTLIAKIKEVLG